MPRRTGFDTVFDNSNVPTPEEMRVLAETGGVPVEVELDPEDINLAAEGVPGQFGNRGERRDEMDYEEYETAIGKAISNAENYIDMELSPDRELAARYYRGEPFGNEVENRSQVVMTEVRDTVRAMMPALLRIFCGSQDAVEFINNESTPEEQAKAQTAYINHIIHVDNPGFTIFHSAFKDALIRKTGIFTWWHEEKEVVSREVHTGLNEDAFALLQLEHEEASNEDEYLEYEIEVLEEREDTTAPGEIPDLLAEGASDPLAPGADPTDVPPPPPQSFIRDVAVEIRRIKKLHRLAAVPPEEFIVSPTMSDNIDEFPLIGRRMMRTIGDLVALGHSEEEIREAIGGGGGARSDHLVQNPEAVDRMGAAAVERIFDTGFQSVDQSSEYVKYCEVFVLIDKDGDGIIERRKICTVGNAHKIIYDEVVGEMVPYALICPDPEPHSPFGYSVADDAMDLQEVKSEVVRATLDGLAESIVGRTAIIEGQVNIDDVLSPDRDQVIRMKSQGAIQQLSRQFNGMNTIPIMEYIDNIKARRTGITMSPAGLSADALQSTSTQAVEKVVDASQERTEMVARIFAETGIKRLMRGLLQNVVKHQDRKRMIRLRGRPVTVDPRAFNADLDLQTNVGLGRGTGAKRLAGIVQIIGMMERIFDKYGLQNPIFDLSHVSNACEDYVREVGFNDVSRYMNVLTKAEAVDYAQRQANAPKPPSAEELMYKANAEKLLADTENKRRSDMIKLVVAMMTNKRNKDKDDQDFYLEASQILGKFGIALNDQELKRMQMENTSIDADVTQAMQGAQQAKQIAGPTGG